MFVAVTLSMLLQNRAYAQTKPFRWKGWGGKQGSYKVEFKENSNDQLRQHSIRFINIEYLGANDRRYWNQAWEEAVRHYQREDISFRRGSDGNFFTVGNLSKSKVRIVGFYDYTSNEGGYLVVTKVANGSVEYTMPNGRRRSIGSNPDNFERKVLGTSPGVFSLSGSYNFRHVAAIQIWKHNGRSHPDAGVCLRLLKETY